MKVLVTRAEAQSQAFGAALEQAGFTPVYFPVIEIRPAEDLTGLDRALEQLNRYDWIIFTSTNTVEIVCSRPTLASGWPNPAPRVAAIGPKTAQALAAHGVPVDFMPGEYTADAILGGLGPLSDVRVLMPCAELARQDLAEAIVEAGGIVHKIIVYHTLPATPNPDSLAALKSGVELVTFTSPSTVTNFIHLAREAGLDPKNLPGRPRFVCIGPITCQAAEEAGLSNPMVATDYTTDGLVELLLRVKHPE